MTLFLYVGKIFKGLKTNSKQQVLTINADMECFGKAAFLRLTEGCWIYAFIHKDGHLLHTLGLKLW